MTVYRHDAMSGVTNTAFGTSTQEAHGHRSENAHSTKGVDGGVSRHQITQAPKEGFVHIPGFGETTIEAAKAAGLWKPEMGDSLPTKGITEVSEVDRAKELEKTEADKAKATEAELYAKADAALDAMEETVGREGILKMTEAAITLEDPTVLDAIPQPIIDGYMAKAEAIAAQAGLESLAGMNILPGELQADARRALVTGDYGKFQRYVGETINIANQVAADPEYQQDLREKGCTVVNGSIRMSDGSFMPISKAILLGYLGLE